MHNPRRCPKCNGSGRIPVKGLTPVPMTKKCDVCNGTGYVEGS